MAALSTGCSALCVYQSPTTTKAAKRVKKKMVPLLNGKPNVLTKNTSKAESTLTMPGMMPHRMMPSVTTDNKPVTMKPVHVVLGHFLKYTT